MLQLNCVSKIYHLTTHALHQVSLSVAPGEIVGLLGENGAGKTTLLKCILGLLSHQGSITLDGAPIGRDNIARLSFATCEHSFFPTLTPQEHRVFYQEHFPTWRDQRFEALMDFFRLPGNRPLRAMSVGQQNQVEVILALCQGADYILMDEPFAGNDVFNREDFYKVLLGILEPTETVILSTHLIAEVADLIEHTVIIRRGHILQDAPTEALTAACWAVSGPAGLVDSWAAGRDVFTSSVLGGLKTVCVRGEEKEDLPAGLERRRVGLQEYFISLMEEEDQR